MTRVALPRLTAECFVSRFIFSVAIILFSHFLSKSAHSYTASWIEGLSENVPVFVFVGGKCEFDRRENGIIPFFKLGDIIFDLRSKNELRF